MTPVDTPEPVRPAPPPPLAESPVPAVVLPPPPPPMDPLPTRLQTQILGGMFGLGALLALIGGLSDFRYATHVELGGLFFATYAALVALSWLPPSVLTRRVDKLLDRWVRNSATGYYGVMALAAFISLEVPAFIDNVLGFELDVQKMIMHRVIGFSVDSMKNLGLAFGWPAIVLKSGGHAIGAGILVAATWSVFHATARILPHATFRKRKAKKDKKKKKKG